MRPLGWKKGLPTRRSEKEFTRLVWSTAFMTPFQSPSVGRSKWSTGADFSHRGVVEGLADIPDQTGHPGCTEKAYSDHAGGHGGEQRAEQ